MHVKYINHYSLFHLNNGDLKMCFNRRTSENHIMSITFLDVWLTLLRTEMAISGMESCLPLLTSWLVSYILCKIRCQITWVTRLHSKSELLFVEPYIERYVFSSKQYIWKKVLIFFNYIVNHPFCDDVISQLNIHVVIKLVFIKKNVVFISMLCLKQMKA